MEELKVEAPAVEQPKVECEAQAPQAKEEEVKTKQAPATTEEKPAAMDAITAEPVPADVTDLDLAITCLHDAKEKIDAALKLLEK